MKWRAALGTLLLAVGCGAVPMVGSAQSGPPVSELDCGEDAKGTKSAFHQFAAILSEGDEDAIRAILEDQREFAWIYAGSRSKSGRKVTLINERRRNAAAAKVARMGGLPITITNFQNASEPSNWAGAGFRGTWGQGHFHGKGSIDCVEGKAQVFSVYVNRPN
jgi:hypothetical protein